MSAGISLRAMAADHMVGAKMERMALFGGGLLEQRNKYEVAFEDTQFLNCR